MDNQFKRSMLTVAISSLAFASASVAAKPATDTVDLYGQIAVSVAKNPNYKNDALVFDNESRIGVRGTAELARGPSLFWQLEGGDVGDKGEGSGLGVRDTFAGLDFADAGKVRIGRMLTPLFEIVDGYTGQSSGEGFNVSKADNAYYDRQSNMLRYDSADLSGLNVSLAAGRGEEDNKDSNFFGISAKYTMDVVTAQVGYESDNDRVITAKTDKVPATAGDSNAIVAGLNIDMDGYGAHVAYLHGKTQADKGAEKQQDSVKLGAYMTFADNWTMNANIGRVNDYEVNGKKVENTGITAVTGQLIYSLDPAAVVYGRLVHTSPDAKNMDSDLGWRMGLEYYF
ncbi:porin [Veronia pacifica]|uniref:Chemotaxis protein n=1 Tax=Veronia pacifica TaxID=1080227 RepID=A0A1C3EEN7_9GAMM|nr:porin [Veronia pacifica]ODA31701.1 chemotaxis protein [Veronia pacifica]